MHVTFTGHIVGIKVVSMIAGTNKHIIETKMVTNIATVVSTICIYGKQPLWTGRWHDANTVSIGVRKYSNNSP